MSTAKTISLFLAFVLGVHCAIVHAQTTELRFVTWRAEAPEVWDQGIADFERQNPGVKVVREIGPQSSTQLHDLDRKSTRLNSSHSQISYAVFCLKKKNIK